MQGIKLKKGSH